MEKFCDYLREPAKNIVDFEKKKKLLLTRKELKSHKDAKESYICWKGIQKNAKDINFWKDREHCHYTGKCSSVVHSICNLKFKVLNEIPVVFRNGSNYDYHFIFKESSNEFERQFECLGKNKEK